MSLINLFQFKFNLDSMFGNVAVGYNRAVGSSTSSERKEVNSSDLHVSRQYCHPCKMVKLKLQKVHPVEIDLLRLTILSPRHFPCC